MINAVYRDINVSEKFTFTFCDTKQIALLVMTITALPVTIIRDIPKLKFIPSPNIH